MNTDRLPEERRARHLDRARLRAAGAAVAGAGSRSSTCPATSGSCAPWSPGATRHRRLPAGRRRRRRRDAPDARARRRAARARRRAAASSRSPRPISPTRRRPRAEAAELLPGAEVVAGLGPAPARASTSCARRSTAWPRAPARPRRRIRAARACTSTASFTVRGAGTVVTGTLWSGLGRPRRRGRAAARAGARPACAASRSTTARSTARRPASASRSTSPGSSVRRGRAAATSSPRRTPRRRRRRRRSTSPSGSARGRRPPARRRTGAGPPRHPRRAGPPGARSAAASGSCGSSAPLVAAAGDRVVRAPDRPAGHARRRRRPRRRARDGTGRPATRSRGSRGSSAASRTRRRREPAPARPARPARAAVRRRCSAAALALEARLREAGLRAADRLASSRPRRPPSCRPCAPPAARCGVGRALHYHPDALAELERRVVERLEADGDDHARPSCATSSARSRKFAQALLEHLDAARVTRRVGDVRVLRRRRGGAAPVSGS